MENDKQIEAMQSTIIGLNAIIATNKLTIQSYEKSVKSYEIIVSCKNEVIATKDLIIERLQSRINELEAYQPQPKPNKFINWLKIKLGIL